MTDPALDAQPVEDLLDLLIRSMGLDLQYRVVSNGETNPQLTVQLSGSDASLLTARNGELLHAIEHIAAKILHLEPEEHERISFDADQFKADRDRDLQAAAEEAIATVRETGQPFAFPPMTSRERRMLHLALQASGLPTASSGENPRRFVVLYPEGHSEVPPPEPVLSDGPSREAPSRDARAHHLRSAFRPR